MLGSELVPQLASPHHMGKVDDVQLPCPLPRMRADKDAVLTEQFLKLCHYRAEHQNLLLMVRAEMFEWCSEAPFEPAISGRISNYLL